MSATRIRITELVYVTACLALSIVIGAGLYEHVVVWPRWSAAPPVSFSMFAGDFGLDPSVLWPRLHPGVMLTVIATLALCWRTPRRRYVTPVLGLYAVTLVATQLYFAPQAIAMIELGVGDVVDPALQTRAVTWERLSALRGLLLVPGTFWMLLGLRQPLSAPDDARAAG